MEILKWFSGNTKWKWKYWIMATFVQTCKFDLDDFIQYGWECGCGYTDQNGVFFLCSCTVTNFLYQCISLDNISLYVEIYSILRNVFLFWVFPPCIAVLVCLLVKATGNWDSEHHLLLLLCLLLTYKYKTIEDGGITVDF